MSFSITPRLIMAAAEKRGWQLVVLNEKRDLYKLITDNQETFYIRNITSYKGNGVGSFISGHKDLAFEIIQPTGLATLPETIIIDDDVSATDFLAQHKKVVVKPSDQSHGDGVTVDITSSLQLTAALELARGYGSKVLMQQQISGDDYRLLFIGGNLAAAAIREPATVLGDGRQTVRELIAAENKRDDRGVGYDKSKTLIDMVAAEQYLSTRLDTIPATEQSVQVVGTANIGKGGLAIDVTDTIDPNLVAQAKRLVDHFKIGLCGVDYLVTDDGQAYFIEINTAPSLGLHEFPVRGKARNTPDTFLDWLAG